MPGRHVAGTGAAKLDRGTAPVGGGDSQSPRQPVIPASQAADAITGNEGGVTVVNPEVSPVEEQGPVTPAHEPNAP